jgi:DNA-binding IscR family transcriptional regulator
MESLTPAECFASNSEASCRLYPRCALRAALQAAQPAYLDALDTYSIAAIADGKRPRGRIIRPAMEKQSVQ